MTRLLYTVPIDFFVEMIVCKRLHLSDKITYCLPAFVFMLAHCIGVHNMYTYRILILYLLQDQSRKIKMLLRYN